MTSYGELKTMRRNVLLIPHLCLHLQKRFPPGRWSFVGPGSEKKCYFTYTWQTTRIMGQEECLRAKEVENYQYTSVLMRIRLKLFFEQLFLLINSVSTEQSQIGVMNTGPVKQERGDPCWQANLTHRLCRQVRWWKHLHLRPKFLHKKIYCKSTKNEW